MQAVQHGQLQRRLWQGSAQPSHTHIRKRLIICCTSTRVSPCARSFNQKLQICSMHGLNSRRAGSHCADTPLLPLLERQARSAVLSRCQGQTKQRKPRRTRPRPRRPRTWPRRIPRARRRSSRRTVRWSSRRGKGGYIPKQQSQCSSVDAPRRAVHHRTQLCSRLL